MSRRRAARAAVFCALIASIAPLQAQAEEHIFSYEAASPSARTLAPTGLSFVFTKSLMGAARVHRIIQTGERGEAEVRPSSESAIGGGGLKAALAGERPAGDLYEIEPSGDGKAFVQAICPGSERAWLVIGPIERFRDLDVQAVGRPAGEPAKRCVSLKFAFRSEWKLPPAREPPRVRPPSNAP
jgi:hypothetical protein